MGKNKFVIPSCIMICVCITIFVYYKTVSALVEHDSRVYLVDVMHQSSKAIQQRVYNVFRTIETVSLSVEKLDCISIDTVIPYLVSIVHRNDFKRMGIIHLDGRVVTTDSGTSWLHNREYVRKALEGKTNLSDALEERMGPARGSINVYATPLRVDGAIAGVLFATCDVDFLGKMLSSGLFGGKGMSYLVRSNGQLVAARQSASPVPYADIRVMLAHPAAKDTNSPLQDMAAGNSGAVWLNIDGHSMLVTYDPVGEDDLFVLAVVPQDVFSAETSRRMAITGGFLLTLTLLLLLWLAYLWRVHRQAAHTLLCVREEQVASRTKSQFLSTVSHEIRTPLNAIVGLMRRLRQTGLTPEQQHCVQKASQSADSLTQIVNDILIFSQLDTGRLQLTSAPFSLATLLGTTCAQVQEAAWSKGLELTVGIAPDTPLDVIGDGPRLGQVVLNLLTNAVKFTSRGEVSVHIRCLPEAPHTQSGHEENGGVAGARLFSFSVQDSGIGLAAEQIHELFKPFVQVDSSRTRMYGGTGLGLAICRYLVMLMGGEIGVTSQLGQGAVFHFTVCLGVNTQCADTQCANTNCAPPQGEVQTADPTGASDNRWVGLRVLVVEDNDINQDIICSLLRDFGLQVDTADNGSEALTLACAYPYPLIFMDLQMPVMDGLEATRRMRALGNEPDSLSPWLAHIPIVALTANDQPDDRRLCAAAGMSGVLGKPLDSEAVHDYLLAWAKTV